MDQNQATKRLFSLLKPYRLLIAVSVIAALFFVAGRTGVSLFIGDFINNVFIAQDFRHLQISQIAVLFAFGFLWSAAQYLMYLFSGKLAIRISHALRGQIYQKIIKFPMSYYDKNSSSHLLSITSNDITLIESFLMNAMVQLLAQPLTVIVIVSTMFIINWKLSLYFLILGPTIGALLGLIGAQIQKIGTNMQENIARLTKMFAETMRHIRVIKGFNSEQAEIDLFNKKNDHQLSLADKEIKIRLFALPMSDFLGITAIILILSLGAVGIRLGIATTSDVTRFVAMAIILSEPISSFNQLILVVKKLGPSAQRVFEIIDTEPEIDPIDKNIGTLKGHIEFQNLSFSYDKQKNVLNKLNISIKAKETIAIVGYSGSGKSTLTSLIPKFYECTEGQLLIDGKDITQYSSASLRSQIALVTQDTSLFSDTIWNNIILSKPNASKDEVLAACHLAHADNFILNHPEQFQRFVGDQGSKLSGGERQRIILARAILKEPAILILDEPTSSLDAQSEAFITEALENIYGQQTTIIIAHKLKTIEKADKIFVMKDGEIIEAGSHSELLSQNSYYKQLFEAHYS